MMELTDTQQADVKEIFSGVLAEKMAELDDRAKVESSNLQKVHSKWTTEVGEFNREAESFKTTIGDLMQKTLDEKVPSMLEPYLKKDQVAPKTEETSADVRKELTAQGKWEDVIKHRSALSEEDRTAIEADDNVLLEYLKQFKGQPKGTSFFDDEPPSGVESPADKAKRIFAQAKERPPAGKTNYQKNSTQNSPKRQLRTVGGGMRAERK